MKLSDLSEIEDLSAEAVRINNVLADINADTLKVLSPHYQIQLYHSHVEKIVDEIKIGYAFRMKQINDRLVELGVDVA